MNKKIQIAKYIVFDYIAAFTAWVLFFIIRKFSIEHNDFYDINNVFADANLYKGVIFIPLCWLFMYIAVGEYANVYKKSRLTDFIHTFIESLIGVIILFFAFLLDDYVSTYKNYYFSFLILFLLQFSLTYIPRLILTTITVRQVHKGKIGFPTLIVTSDEKLTLKLIKDITNQEVSSGYLFTGYVTLNGEKYSSLKNIEHLGKVSDLTNILTTNNIEELIIILDKKDENEIYNIIFYVQNPNIEIFIPSDRKDFLTGNVKLNAIFSIPLVRISQNMMQAWELSVKRFFDVIISLLAIIVLIPVYIVTAIIIKITSKGNILYKQERIGRYGKPFMMYKFRSMYDDAEQGIPMLSCGDQDDRITPFGRFMRKIRLDETPQFFHVLTGKMSMVGLRPERQYFIDQIVKIAPEYQLLQRIKPGMTSWGQVKFGYADNVNQMVERMQYDMLYLENMSLATDIKILLYTFLIIFKGRGK